MYKVLQESSGDTLGLQVISKLTEEDYKAFLPLIEQKIETHGDLNLLIHLKDFEGVELGAVWEDLKFDLKHYNDFKRIAVVGREAWMEWMSDFSELFSSADVEYFEPDQLSEAWYWVKGKEFATLQQS